MEQATGFEDSLVSSVNQTTRISLFEQLPQCHYLSSGRAGKKNHNKVFLLNLDEHISKEEADVCVHLGYKKTGSRWCFCHHT